MQLKTTSSFLAAALIFVLLNLVLGFVNPIKSDPYALPYRNWIWWDFNDLRTSKQPYNVVLLGSSLMISAINSCDANYLNKQLDQTQYHGAAYLDHRLTQVFGGKFNTFNLSTPGQAPADAFLSLRSMINCGKKPDIVIYGIAPRDFIDGTMSSVAAGEPYQYLSRVLNYADIDPQFAYHSPIEKIGYQLQRNVYLCGNAMYLQMMGTAVSTKLLDRIFPNPAGGAYFTWWDRVKFFPEYKAGDVYPGSSVVEPRDLAHRQKFLDDTKDYQARYRSPRKWSYDAQVHFLRRLASYCAEQHVRLFIVNMPITYYNASMLRHGIYASFVKAMGELAKSERVTFFDLCNFDLYPMPLYDDYVHLNGPGGKILVDDLVNHLAESASAKQSLKDAGRQMAQNR
jgi:hypothetical protein